MKLVMIASALAVISTCVQASNCAPRSIVTQRLSEQYGEAPKIEAYNEIGVLEFWSNPETGTWSFTGTSPDGTTCVLSVGEGYFQHPERPQGEDM